MNLLQLIKLLFGPKAMSKTLGTRTNVIRLPDNKLKRYIKEDLNIEAASDDLAKKAYKDMQELVAEVPKMNDAEKLIFEGNLRRLKNKLKIKDPSDPTAEVIEFGTKEKVTPGGIASLTEKAGQKAPPGTVMGNLESRLNRLRASGKELGDIAKEEGGVKFSIPEKGIFNQELSADNLFDTIIKQQERFKKIQDSGLVTSTAREILQRDIKAGKLKLPKEIEDRIMLVDGNPGTVNPVEVFRTNYGEDALEQVDSLIPELAKAQSYSDLVKIVEKKYPMKPLAKPRKETMSLDEATKAEEENILTPKKPEEPEEFATGGRVNRAGFKFGTKLGRFWKIAKKVWDDINPTGDRKYDAQLVADELAEEIFKTSMDDLPQNVQIDLYALAYNNSPKVDALFRNPQSLSEAAKKGMAASKEMESLGLDVTKNSDFFKYEEMKLSGQLGPEQQVQAYKDKIRDEFYGVIDDTLMKQVEVDDNPQRLAEVYASIKEGLEMQRKGMTPEEIIRVMKQTPRTKNATGGRIGYMGGGSTGLDYLMGIDRTNYQNGEMTLEQLQAKAPPGEFLAYINPEEAGVLKALGGSGKKINGIPSFFASSPGDTGGAGGADGAGGNDAGGGGGGSGDTGDMGSEAANAAATAAGAASVGAGGGIGGYGDPGVTVGSVMGNFGRNVANMARANPISSMVASAVLGPIGSLALNAARAYGPTGTTSTTSTTESDGDGTSNALIQQAIADPLGLNAAARDMSGVNALYNQYRTNVGFQSGGRVNFNEGTLNPAKQKQIKQMIKMGADVDTISTITGATPEQIQQVQQTPRIKNADGGLNYLLGF